MDTALKVRKTEFQLSVQAAWSQKSGVKGVRSVGRHQNFDVAARFEAVELVDNFEHSPLVITTSFTLASTSHGINLIKKDDARLFGARELENLSNHASTFADVPLVELTTNDSDKAGVGSVSDGAGSQGFASSRGTEQQYTFWWVDTKRNKSLGVQEWHLNNFSDLFNLLFAAANIVVGHVRLFLNSHHSYSGVDLWWQWQHDGDFGSNLVGVLATNSHAFLNICWS